MNFVEWKLKMYFTSLKQSKKRTDQKLHFIRTAHRTLKSLYVVFMKQMQHFSLDHMIVA